MSFRRTIKRFAHVSGYTHVSWTNDGEIITSGSQDGDVRTWKEVSDDDPSCFCIGESAFCSVQFSPKNGVSAVLCSTDNNNLQRYKYPEGDRDGVVLRFSAVVTSIKISEKWIFAGSNDSTIKVQKREVTDEFIEIKGHQGPILHLDYNEVKNQLASSSGDGTLCIWTLQPEPIVLKTFEGFEKVSEFVAAEVYSSPSFDPSGKMLAFPRQKFIEVVNTNSWESLFKLENSAVIGKYSICSISLCGTFVAAGSTKGEISVWKLADKSKLEGMYAGEDQHGITSMAWNPKRKEELAFCDADGQLSSIEASTSKEVKNFETENPEEVADDLDDLYEGIEMRDDDNDEDEDNENCVSLGKLKNETLKGNLSGDDDDDDGEKTVRSLASTSRAPLAPQFRVQPSFQPGSTPANLEHRFMVFNEVGHVVCHLEDDESSIITEFHDVNIHPSIHILNKLNHELASLSKTCLAMATRETPCRLVCIAFVASGGKEWSFTMPDCEVIEGIAAGENFVAAATDSGFVRFFTTMGTQREVIAVPGAIVALAASGNKLAIAYHTSETRNKFSLMIVTVIGLTLISRTVEVPLTLATKLLWLGFSDMDSVITYDSSGRVMSFNAKRNIWYPICDMMQHISGASDNFFIISVSESELKIRATLCRGTNYPLTNPRPIVREIDYELPLCSMETERSKLESGLLALVNFTGDSSEKNVMEKGLKLFSTAMNSELESKAYELVELLGNNRLVELAAKYASQKGRLHMANKITKLLLDFDEKEKRREMELKSVERENQIFSESYDLETSNTVEKRIPETSTPMPLITPKPMLNYKKLNPFKKSVNGQKASSTKLLDHLTSKSIGHSNSDDENTPSNNSTNSSNRSVSLDTPRPGNFGQWFIANKSDLETSHSEASDTELMKIARNLYKELTQKQKAISDQSATKDNQNSSNLNKRKLNMSEEGGGIAKLAKFGFTKE